MENRTVYALGFFDGVHLGHRALLRECRILADRLGCKAGAVTFDRHPAALMGGAPKLVNTVQTRTALLKEAGMDTVCVLPFDDRLMHTPWQAFFDRLLGEFGACGLVCGDDYRFGARGEGNAELLKEACSARGVPCVVVPEKQLKGVRVSSSHIRGLIEGGEMAEAVSFLGHPHVIAGTVVEGKQLGRTIGIPTANLLLPEAVVCPRFGVYACKASVDGKEYLAVTNVGVRPTVSGSGITVEPWLLDFEGDLYGKTVELAFYAFLRPEKKFASLEELQAEIRKNGEETRKFFGKK